MKRHIILIVEVISIFLFYSCSDFLEEYSQNMSYIEDINDLDELLLGEAYCPKLSGNGTDPEWTPRGDMWSYLSSERLIHHFLMDDDIAEYVAGIEGDYLNGSDKTWTRYQAANTFYWQPDPYIDNMGFHYNPDAWKNYYHHIAAANSILYQIDKIDILPTDTIRARIEGEARFLRANYYFALVNAYAQPYSKATAEDEPGIPLKTNAEIEDHFFSRNTIQEVYDLIVSDLVRSVECLENYPPFERKVRTNYVAAATLLSRVYLYMEEYDLAIKAADMAINSPYFKLLDLTRHDLNKSFASMQSPEVLFTQSGSFMAALHQNDSINASQNWWEVFGRPCSNGYTTSEELYRMYDKFDLRKKSFFVPHHYGKNTYRCLKVRQIDDNVVGEEHVIRLAEAYLNKAEALAISGKENEAKEALTKLMQNRYFSGHVPVLNMSGKELVNYIRDERRRELCYEGHRWYDLRRYAVNSRYPFSKEIVHEAYMYQASSPTEGVFYKAGKYVLKPYAEDKNTYVLPLPPYAVLFNEGVLEQNPARPEREMLPL